MHSICQSYYFVLFVVFSVKILFLFLWYVVFLYRFLQIVVAFYCSLFLLWIEIDCINLQIIVVKRMKGKSNERARSEIRLNSNARRWKSQRESSSFWEAHPPEKETPETPPLNRIYALVYARQTTYDWEKFLGIVCIQIFTIFRSWWLLTIGSKILGMPVFKFLQFFVVSGEMPFSSRKSLWKEWYGCCSRILWDWRSPWSPAIRISFHEADWTRQNAVFCPSQGGRSAAIMVFYII